MLSASVSAVYQMPSRTHLIRSMLRRLLDAQLAEQIESPHAADLTGHEEVIGAMMALLARDGLSS